MQILVHIGIVINYKNQTWGIHALSEGNISHEGQLVLHNTMLTSLLMLMLSISELPKGIDRKIMT
jgi:hypothetical protein